MKAATKKATKELVLIARYTFKNGKAVVYRVRSNQPNKKGRVEGVDQVEFKGEWFDAHNVTCIEDEVKGCTCKGSEYKSRCYHRDGIQVRLVERKEVAQQFAAKTVPTWVMQLVNAGKLIAPKQVVKTAQEVVSERATYWDDNRACICYRDTRKPTGSLEGIDFGSTPMRWNAEEECFTLLKVS